jgi:hypothetical protein
MMKTFILKVFAALAVAGLMLSFSPSLLKNTSLAWINLDSLSMRHNFYFGKRQWLADARTIMAAVRYLCQARSADPSSPMDAISIQGFTLAQFDASSDLLVLDGTESTTLPYNRRLSRGERLIVRKRLLTAYGPPPIFASADSPSYGLYDLQSSNRNILNRFTRLRIRTLRSIALPTNAAPLGLRSFSPDSRASSLQGV